MRFLRPTALFCLSSKSPPSASASSSSPCVNVAIVESPGRCWASGKAEPTEKRAARVVATRLYLFDASRRPLTVPLNAKYAFWHSARNSSSTATAFAKAAVENAPGGHSMVTRNGPPDQ